MREPPPYEDIDPASMTDRELGEKHRMLAVWIEEALSAPLAQFPADDVYDAVYEKLSEISRERAARQLDDRSGRSAQSNP